MALSSGNLHSYWDSRLGSSETERFLTQLADTIQRRRQRPTPLAMNPVAWAEEGYVLRTQVYAFKGDGTEMSPATLSDSYAANARENSYERAAMAGYRLAEFLNQRFSKTPTRK